MLDERSVQTVSTPFNIFKNKENVESMLNESLNQFKFDSTHFQQAFEIFFFTLSTMLNDLLKRTRHLFNNCVERMLKQMLKPFKRACDPMATLHQEVALQQQIETSLCLFNYKPLL